MSVNNFKPTIWSALIIDTLRKSLVYGDVVNRNYEGEIRNGGEKVKILQIGDIDVGTYTGATITYQDLEDASQYLEIDQKKYFAINLDDVDKAQVNVDLMSRAADKAAYKLADTSDQYIASLYTGAGVLTSLGTTASPLTVTSDGASSTTSIRAFLAKVAQRLDEKNCPQDGRFIIVPPWMHQKMILAETTRVDAETAVTQNGRIGRIHGFDVRMSNNVATVTSGTVYKVLAGTTEAMSYADQLLMTEALRKENTFSDAIRGLHVYGAKVVQADALACASVSEGST